MDFSCLLKRRGFGLSAFFISVSIAPGQADAAPASGIFTTFETTWISEPESVNTTLEEWGKDFHTGERQWSFSQLELGFRFASGLEISVLQRAMADLRVNREAASFYGRIERKDDLAPREEVPVHLEVNGLSAQGLRSGYSQSLDQFDLEVGGGVTLLYAHHLISGELNGRFKTVSGDDYEFDADVGYVYYRDVLFERPDIERPDGFGWAGDVYALWTPMPDLRLKLDIKDIAAKVRWRDAPFTRAKASTDRKRYDSDGYAVFDPLLSGTEGYLDTYTQRLDPRIGLSADWAVAAQWGIAAEFQRQFEYTRVALGGLLQSGATSEVKLLYWPEQEAISIATGWRDWSAALMIDQIEWQKVQSVGLTFSYRHR